MAEAGHNKTPTAAETPVVHAEAHGGHDAHAEVDTKPGILKRIGHKVKALLWNIFVEDKKPANDNAAKHDDKTEHATADTAHVEEPVAAGTVSAAAKEEPKKAEKTEAKEKDDLETVKAVGVSKNKGGIGLTAALQKKMGVKAGDKVYAVTGGADGKPLTVEDIDPKLCDEKMGDNVVSVDDYEKNVASDIQITKTQWKAANAIGKPAANAPAEAAKPVTAEEDKKLAA